MTPQEATRLIESYVASQKLVLDADGVLRPGDDSSWATEALYDLARSDLPTCLRLCAQIAELDSSPSLLESLANGPLIELLKSEDRSTNAEVQALAANSPALRGLLAYVWDDHGLSEDRWALVQSYSAPE